MDGSFGCRHGRYEPLVDPTYRRLNDQTQRVSSSSPDVGRRGVTTSEHLAGRMWREVQPGEPPVAWSRPSSTRLPSSPCRCRSGVGIDFGSSGVEVG